MAAFRGRQAQCKGFRIDFVGYSQRFADDSFVTPRSNRAQESIDYLLGVCLTSGTNRRPLRSIRVLVYVGDMLRNRIRMVSATKDIFGVGTSCAIV
jgi:hypothetical protein